MKKLWIFDLDGTLTNTLDAISYFGNTALKNNGFTEITKDRYRYLVGDGRDILIHRMLAVSGNDTPENFTRVVKSYDEAYEANPLYKTAPYEGIPELLSALSDAGCTLCVLSNKPDNVVKDIVKLFFGDIFKIVMGHKPSRKIKPDPESVLYICEKCGISVEDAVFVGDTDVDIKTGKNAKMNTVGVLWGFRDKDELTKAGADYIAEKPMDIFNNF